MSRLFRPAVVFAAAFALAAPTAAAAAPATTIAPLQPYTKFTSIVTNATISFPSYLSFPELTCALDGVAFSPCGTAPLNCATVSAQTNCTGGVRVGSLTEGAHTLTVGFRVCDAFSVSECDLYGWGSGPTATASFTVDHTAPVVTLLSGATAKKPAIRERSKFAFATSEPVENSLCRLDRGSDDECAGAFTLPRGIKNGTHTLTVTAIDKAGNERADKFNFKVDVLRPKRCPKGSSDRAKRKRAKCLKQNKAAKRAWKKRNR